MYYLSIVDSDVPCSNVSMALGITLARTSLTRVSRNIAEVLILIEVGNNLSIQQNP